MTISYIILLIVCCVTRLNLIFTLLGMPGTYQNSVNLTPLHSILMGWGKYGFLSWDAFGNMLMFIPLGIMFCVYQKRRSFWGASSCCLLCSVGIEALQFVFKTGAVDIDDVILNTLGGFFGVCIYYAIEVLLHKSRGSLKDVVAVCATIFPPFLMFYIVHFFFGIGAYRFALWHVGPLLFYFLPNHFLFLRDLTKRQKAVYYLATLLFCLYFFGLFL